MISATTRLFGLIGDPVAQSVSPTMHNAAVAALGLDYAYLAFRVPVPALMPAVGGLRALGATGFNVTIPHKVNILPLLDELDAEAAEIGAVNTVINSGGRLRGYNTDAGGFLAALGQHGIDPAGMRVALIGAGGAARAIAYALIKKRASVSILARRPDTAQELAQRFSQKQDDISGLELNDANLQKALDAADLLVNATSTGMVPEVDQTAVPAGLLRPGLIVFDAVYHPLRTRLLREASEKGAVAVGGLEMLVEQAALSFELWTGQKAPRDIMAKAAREALIR